MAERFYIDSEAVAEPWYQDADPEHLVEMVFASDYDKDIATAIQDTRERCTAEVLVS